MLAAYRLGLCAPNLPSNICADPCSYCEMSKEPWHLKYPISLNVSAAVQSSHLIQLNKGNTSTSSWLEKIALIRIQCYVRQTDFISLSYTIEFCNVVLVLESGSENYSL